jgi:hypothetical protein
MVVSLELSGLQLVATFPQFPAAIRVYPGYISAALRAAKDYKAELASSSFPAAARVYPGSMSAPLRGALSWPGT